MKLPFGRLMLFFIITAGLFGLFSMLRWINPFFTFYTSIAWFSLKTSAVCFVIWLIITLFLPGSLFELSQSVKGIRWLDVVFCKIPYFKISMLSLIVSIVLAWLHKLVFPIFFTIFILSIEMLLARLLFFIYGSAGR